jgi:hypothetical protein
MFNKLKTTTLAAVTAAATLLGSGQAWALEFAGDIGISQTANQNATGCYIAVWKNDSNGWAGVQRLIATPTSPTSGGSWWRGSVVEPGAAMDEASIESMCGVTDVDIIRNVGASGNFFTQSYLGIEFTARSNVDGLMYHYEFALSGATTTVGIATRTLLDNTSPTVTLSGTQAPLTNTDPFTVTAIFSEDVTGFEEADVTVTNGSVVPGSLSGGPAAYTFLVEPTGNGDVTITVPQNVAQDAANNDNTESNTLRIGNRIVDITQEQIAGFMLTRANNLASNQPGLTRFLMGEGCGNFNLSATNGSGSVSGCVTRGNTWAEITSAWSGDGSYTLGTLGAHASLNPNLLVGGMVQFDYADDPANNASGKGYMVGPYFVAKLPEQPLYFEGRLLYGQTDNEISPLGTYTDSFETERWLAQLRATGEYKLRNTTLMPLLDVTYTEDNQRAYTDSLGNTIPSQAVDLMQVSAGLDFSTPIPVQMGNLELTGGIKGIYSSTNGGTAAPEFENWRGRTTLGLNYDTGRGGTLKFGSFYDGLGTNYESYGASLNFDMKF